MTGIELVLVAVGLSMDAAAVSMANGMSLKSNRVKYALAMGAIFGFFQMAMPVAGYFAGRLFFDIISDFDHWIALVLLGFIGGRMIFESFKKDDSEDEALAISVKRLVIQAIATSIDALTVGISFAALGVNIFEASAAIGGITFVISFGSVFLGCVFGKMLGGRAEFLGGTILVAMGIKIFVEHMFF